MGMPARNQVVPLKALHHDQCDFWTDHIPGECTCGATQPRAPWFDAAEEAARRHKEDKSNSP